jgi:phenylacetate-CoA ligase
MRLADYAQYYYWLPVWLQNVVCSLYGWREARIRFGKTFYERLAFLEEAQWWSPGEVEAYQNEQLHNLIVHAYTHVPYYRRIMRDRSLTPAGIRTRQDLHKLPILTKEEVRTHKDELIADTADQRRLVKQHTSGTTGSSLSLYQSPEAVAFQWAVWWHHRGRFGMSLGDKHVNFTGKPVVNPSATDPPFWRWNWAFNQALVPMQHTAPQKAGAIVDFLNQEAFPYMVGYPSTIAPLFTEAREQGLSLKTSPEMIFTGAENLHPFQREQIEAFTRSRVTDQYGTTEGCGNASSCPEGVYHVDSTFGIMERPEGGEPHEGRIIATGFACPEFPLIRYEVGDVARWAPPEHNCPCGRTTPVIESIIGRQEDYVVTPEGHRVMRFGYLFKDTHTIKEAQIVQRQQGAIVIRIVRRPSFDSSVEEKIKQGIRRWISASLEVQFEYPASLEREANGKLRAVKSILEGDV